MTAGPSSYDAIRENYDQKTAESNDPTDRDRFHLKTLVRKLKLKVDSLTDENQQMAGVIDSIKSGRYNESESAKLIMGEQ